MIEEAERLRICRHLLLSSPPGQFDLILSDLKNILMPNTSSISQAWIDKIRRERSEMDFPHGTPSTSEKSSEFYKSLEKSIQQLAKRKFCGKGVTVSSAVVDKSNVFIVFIFAENTQNLNNCFASSRSSTYLLKLVGGDTDFYAMTGRMVIRSHAFEHGNIQLSTKQKYGPVRIEVDSNSVSNIVKQIDEWESLLTNNLREMYGTMNEGMLKSMRRIMPITRTKMDWNIQTHRIVKTLNETTK